MRSIFITILWLFCLVGSVQAQSDLEEKIESEVSKLNWQFGPAVHKIASSKATINTIDEDAFVDGEEARQFMRLSEGHDRFKPDAIMVKVAGLFANSVIAYTHLPLGYLKMDDWAEHINADELLSLMKANNAENNKVRDASYPSLSILGWAEKPSLDRTTATVHWAISAMDSRGTKIINAQAIKLGRDGLTVILWMGPANLFTNAASNLAPALQAYDYDAGYTYANFQPGVHSVAALGIGAFVYKTLTGTSKKFTTAAGAGFVVLVVALAKKLWFLVLLPFVVLGGWIKRRFSRV